MITGRCKWLCAAALLSLAGCGGPGSSYGQVDDTIIGGAADAKDAAVVLLFAQLPNTNQGFLCSGTLVSPTVVVTAAHCVDPASVGKGDTFQVFFGADWAQPGPDAWVDVKEVHWDGAFNIANLGGGHDVAVAILAKASAVPPLPHNRGPLDAGLVGGAVRVVGFGVNDGKNLTGVGVKRTVTTSLDDLDRLFLHVGESQHQSCEGDSGGPAFISLGGVETLVGVTSFGQAGCVGGSWHTRIDAYAAFIDQYVPVVQIPVPAPEPRQLAKHN